MEIVNETVAIKIGRSAIEMSDGDVKSQLHSTFNASL